MGKEKNRENTESTKQNKNNKAEEQTSSEIISENNGDCEEIIRGDNYIIAFEKDGIRLEIKDKEEDEVFGELSKNTRIIPYDVITVTVFFMWGNLSSEPVKSLVMRVNQTDDGFDEEGSLPYSEKLLSTLKRYGMKIVNEQIKDAKPDRSEKPQAVFKNHRRLPLKIGFLVLCGMMSLISAIFLVANYSSSPIFYVMLISGVTGIPLSVVFIKNCEKLVFYKDFFGYYLGSSLHFVLMHKKSIDAIMVLVNGKGESAFVSFYLPGGEIDFKCPKTFYRYINDNLRKYVRVYDEIKP